MWQQIFSASYQYLSQPVVLDYLFRTSTLVVRSELPGTTRTFKLAGRLVPLFYDSAFEISRGRGKRFNLGTQQITFENPLEQEFQLEFTLFPWVANVNLTFWTNTSLSPELGFLEAIRTDLFSIEQKIDELD